MPATLAQIWRYPIKSHGREALTAIDLTEGQSMPFDRHWAVTHEVAKITDGEWAKYVNFIRGAISPAHCAITASFDEKAHEIALCHPEYASFPPTNPDNNPEAIIAFSTRIAGDLGRTPTRLVKLAGRGFTDTDYPSVSLLNNASLAALEGMVGTPMGVDRWRGNFWLDGLAAWAENELIGKQIRLGNAMLEIAEPIARCRATETDPARGVLDIETRRHLRSLNGDENFGVYARVIGSGAVTLGDQIEVIA